MTQSLFWLEDPMSLWRDIRLLPKESMTLPEQLNCITRLVIFIYLILFLIGYQQAVLFLLLSLIFIIILYYLQKNKMTTCENYAYPNTAIGKYIDKSETLYNEGIREYKTNRYTYGKHPSYFVQQIEEPVEIRPDQSFVSNNQSLVGGANPKTHIAPIVAAPIYEWNVWKANDFVVPNVMNQRTRQDFYGSGYYSSPDPHVETPPPPRTYPSNSKRPVNAKTPYDTTSVIEPVTENFTYLDDNQGKKADCKSCQLPDARIEPQTRTNGDFKRFEEKKGMDKKIRYTGDVNDQFGYDPTNLQYGLPSNYQSSNCQRNTNVTRLNNEIFTSTITPGVYYKNEIIEPISSNIGISFDQQIPPRRVERNANGVTYTSMDPKLYVPVPEPEEPLDVASTYDVYDPRSNGYGTSYRGYTDKMTGQPRFYYDDIDSVRRPNYITRTNIDHLRSVDTYGPIKNDEETRESNRTIRTTVENAFQDQTIDFRTDMMTRLMRKRNAEMWQLRLAPKTGMQKNFKC